MILSQWGICGDYFLCLHDIGVGLPQVHHFSHKSLSLICWLPFPLFAIDHYLIVEPAWRPLWGELGCFWGGVRPERDDGGSLEDNCSHFSERRAWKSTCQEGNLYITLILLMIKRAKRLNNSLRFLSDLQEGREEEAKKEVLETIWWPRKPGTSHRLGKVGVLLRGEDFLRF